MSGALPRGGVQDDAEMSPTTTDACTEEASDDDICSYEKRGDKRVAKMKELMLPLVQASNAM